MPGCDRCGALAWEAVARRWERLADKWEGLCRQSMATCRRWEWTMRLMIVNVALAGVVGFILGRYA